MRCFPIHVERLRGVMAGFIRVAKNAQATRLLRRLSLHARRTTGKRVTEED